MASDTGLGGLTAGRVLWVDLNGDTFADCILDNRRVFLNHGDRDGMGRFFVEFTEASQLNVKRAVDGVVRYADCLQAGDIDNDGDNDLFSGKYCDLERPKLQDDAVVVDEQGNPVMAVADDGFRSRVFLNDGSGRFTLVEMGLSPNRPETTVTALFFDYDLDGVLDLAIGNWYRHYGLDLECYPSRLFRGKGDGSFMDVTEDVGMMTVAEPGLSASARPIYGLSHTDYNNDGWQDLILCAYGRQWNRLYENQEGRFIDVAPRTGVDGDDSRSGAYPEWVERETEDPFRSNGNTFDAACADFDNDGDVDVFLAEITHAWAGDSSDPSTLLVNQGEAHDYRFDRTLDAGIDRPHTVDRWNQGDLYAAWIDYDNDGLQDLLISSGDYPDGQFLRLFQQDADHKFHEVTREAGFNWEGSGCLSLADYDHDGDVDILVTRNNTRLPAERSSALQPRVALFRNNVGHRNHWLSIRLEGSGRGGANRSAIGARVEVVTDGKVQMREVYGGRGHNTHSDEYTLTFGLGSYTAADRVIIHWPERQPSATVLDAVAADQRLTVIESRAPTYRRSQ